MKIPKWSKRDLLIMGSKGYSVVPCKDAKETEQVYNTLKANKRCAQVGYAINKENKEVFFVCTKKKAERVVENGQQS